MSIKLSICIVLLAVLCYYTQSTFAKQQQQQDALASVNSNLSENNNEAENYIGEQSKLETVLKKPTDDKDDEDNDDLDGGRRRRRRGRRNRRGRRKGRRGGKRRGRRGYRRHRRNRFG